MKNIKIRGYPLWYARGTPLVKFSDGPFIKIRGKPDAWLHWNSRVLAAEKTDCEIGVFILNRDCFVETEVVRERTVLYLHNTERTVLYAQP